MPTSQHLAKALLLIWKQPPVALDILPAFNMAHRIGRIIPGQLPNRITFDQSSQFAPVQTPRQCADFLPNRPRCYARGLHRRHPRQRPLHRERIGPHGIHPQPVQQGQIMHRNTSPHLVAPDQPANRPLGNLQQRLGDVPGFNPRFQLAGIPPSLRLRIQRGIVRLRQAFMPDDDLPRTARPLSDCSQAYTPKLAVDVWSCHTLHSIMSDFERIMRDSDRCLSTLKDCLIVQVFEKTENNGG